MLFASKPAHALQSTLTRWRRRHKLREDAPAYGDPPPEEGGDPPPEESDQTPPESNDDTSAQEHTAPPPEEGGTPDPNMDSGAVWAGLINLAARLNMESCGSGMATPVPCAHAENGMLFVRRPAGNVPWAACLEQNPKAG